MPTMLPSKMFARFEAELLKFVENSHPGLLAEHSREEEFD